MVVMAVRPSAFASKGNMGSASSIEDIAVADAAAIQASSWAARLVHRDSGTNLAAACRVEASVVAACSTTIVS